MEKQIILERNLDFNQFKNVFILSFVSFFIFLICAKYGQTEMTFFAGIFLIILTILMFLKKGLVIGNMNSISVGYFLFGILLKTNKIETKGMPILSVLIFGKHPNYNYTNRVTLFSRWEPNLEYRTQSYQLCLLNENHRIKRKFLSLMKEDSSNKAVEFLEQFTNLKLKKYNPNNK
jgi:hypothetical protein